MNNNLISVRLDIWVDDEHYDLLYEYIKYKLKGMTDVINTEYNASVDQYVE